VLILDLNTLNEDVREQVAHVLLEGMAAGAPNAWTTIEAAREEVAESLAPGRLSMVALDDEGAVIGWIGGISQYDGNAFELHPLVVKNDRRRRGVGSALVSALEKRARDLGAVTMFLGTDDEVNRTSLSGKNLYPNPLEHAAAIQNLASHPFGFYQKVGYAVVGVLPDANGFGKPDIFMAKRLRAPPT
jgi:aminoglycoside 6'-N-acetyltransferase I